MMKKMTKLHRTNRSLSLHTSWMVSLFLRVGYCRTTVQSDGEPSIVALKTPTLLAASFLESVLCESPVSEHATNGVAESAMREVKRQPRTLNFALHAHVGKIVESHPILRWIPTMASDAISFFFMNGRDGLTAEVRRSACVLEETRCGVRRVCLTSLRGSKNSCKANATNTENWLVSWAPRMHQQHSLHGDRWSGENSMVSKGEC